MANLALLLALAVVFREVVDRVETLRRYLSQDAGSYANAVSVWLLAGALILPFQLAIMLPVLMGVHGWWRAHRTATVRTYRFVFTVAMSVASTAAAAAAAHGASGGARLALDRPMVALAAVLGLAAFSATNTVLLTAVRHLTAPAGTALRWHDVWLDPDEELLELADLTLGVLVAVAVVDAPVLTPAALVLLVVLRRSALVRQLQQQATQDARTGLLNAGGWRQEAERELARSARSAGDVTLLMIDLDHFKVLNDTHGHQAGDAALKAVADCLSETLRGYDALGRYGGEEFAALLVDADEITGEAVAERVCARIRALTLPGEVSITASVGVATARAASTDLDDLVRRADAALYAAKNAGRDRVRAAAMVAVPARRPV